MHPTDCPDWEYDHHPRRAEVLLHVVALLLEELRSGEIDYPSAAKDTRPVHRRLFSALTPPGHEYYAGHYRGEPFRCLRHLSVGIPSDPRVGTPPENVIQHMRLLEESILDVMGVLSEAKAIPNVTLPAEHKAIYAVTFACRIFTEFLRIHPYANGNGHAARFITWAILGCCGFWPTTWTIEPRPPNPPYIDLIEQYRNGNVEPLEQYVLSRLR